jgi:hypothetical protein
MSGKRKKYCGIPTEQQLVADVDCCYKVVEELVDSVWDETYQPLGMHQSPHPTCLKFLDNDEHNLACIACLGVHCNFLLFPLAGFARPFPPSLDQGSRREAVFCFLLPSPLPSKRIPPLPRSPTSDLFFRVLIFFSR